MRRFPITVALAIALAVLFALMGVSGCSDASTADGTDEADAGTQTVEVTMLIRDAQPGVGESFEVGQPMRVKDTGTLLGEITDVSVDGALASVPDADGELHASRSPVLVDIWLTVEGQATVSDEGFRFGNEFVYVNNDIKYLTPFTQFFGIVTEMKVVGE